LILDHYLTCGPAQASAQKYGAQLHISNNAKSGMQARTLMDVKREHKGVPGTFQNRKMFETKRMHDKTMAATAK
jgi:hypothetical protein